MSHKSCGAEKKSDYKERCFEAFRKDGGRLTEPRKAVVEILSASQKPMSVKEIELELEKTRSEVGVDKVSIYRILASLSESGLVHELSSGKFFPCTHSGCDSSLHLVMRCLECGMSSEDGLPEKLASELLEFVEQEQKFKRSEHFLQIDGICSRCQKQGS